MPPCRQQDQSAPVCGDGQGAGTEVQAVYGACETTQTHVLILCRISAPPSGSLWISFENKRDLAIAVEGDEAMFNQYGVILMSPEQAIAGYKLNDEQLFYPNAQGQS
jgi:hypothetical protein